MDFSSVSSLALGNVSFVNRTETSAHVNMHMHGSHKPNLYARSECPLSGISFSAALSNIGETVWRIAVVKYGQKFAHPIAVATAVEFISLNMALATARTALDPSAYTNSIHNTKT